MKEKKSKRTMHVKTDSAGMHSEEDNLHDTTVDTKVKVEKKGPHSINQPGKRISREGRLIVRNLPYKLTLDKLKEHFTQCGELTDAVLLKKSDGKLVGCGFVQYSTKDNASKAVSSLNRKPLLGRPIIVDWAVPKNQYQKVIEETSNVKSEDGDISNADVEVKQEEESMSLDGDEDSNGPNEDDSNESERDDDIDDDDSDRSESDDNDEIKNEKPKHKQAPLKSDISEGCTIFVKNIPFTVDNEELRETMKEFGKLQYALICIDPLSEHSKGTGFVKFKSKTGADACLTAGGEKRISIAGRILEVHPALSREDASKPQKKDRNQKDNRNLYLAKEGLVLPDSPAASGVSQTDMERRLGLEEKKRRLLKNLHHFISPTRLTIYNIPPTYDDQQLRSLFLKYGGPKSVITEARIMRHLRDVDANGKGRSKGFGFVTFTSHENALQALRGLNNNPDIFIPAKRPIVMFSIEDRAKLNIQKKRMERGKRNVNRNSKETVIQKEWENNRRLHKSQGNKTEKLPTSKEAEKSIIASPDGNNKLSKKDKQRLRGQTFRTKRLEKRILKQNSPQTSKVHHEDTRTYQGVNSLPGQTSIISKKKLDEQAQIYLDNRKKEKTLSRRQRLKTNERIKQPKQKMRKSKDSKDDNFSKLVNRYKQQLNSTANDRQKWYEG